MPRILIATLVRWGFESFSVWIMSTQVVARTARSSGWRSGKGVALGDGREKGVPRGGEIGLALLPLLAIGGAHGRDVAPEPVLSLLQGGRREIERVSHRIALPHGLVEGSREIDGDELAQRIRGVFHGLLDGLELVEADEAPVSYDEIEDFLGLELAVADPGFRNDLVEVGRLVELAVAVQVDVAVHDFGEYLDQFLIQGRGHDLDLGLSKTRGEGEDGEGETGGYRLETDSASHDLTS